MVFFRRRMLTSRRCHRKRNFISNKFILFHSKPLKNICLCFFHAVNCRLCTLQCCGSYLQHVHVTICVSIVFWVNINQFEEKVFFLFSAVVVWTTTKRRERNRTISQLVTSVVKNVIFFSFSLYLCGVSVDLFIPFACVFDTRAVAKCIDQL